MSFLSAFSRSAKEAPTKSEGIQRSQAFPTAAEGSQRFCTLLTPTAAVGPWSLFPAGPSVPSAPAQGNQAGQSKPVPVGHASLAHPQHHHHEGPTDLDLYRTFSPSDVGMWSWEATTGGTRRVADTLARARNCWGEAEVHSCESLQKQQQLHISCVPACKCL